MKRATWLILFSARWPSILTREAFLGRASNDWAEKRDDCEKPIHVTERRASELWLEWRSTVHPQISLEGIFMQENESIKKMNRSKVDGRAKER